MFIIGVNAYHGDSSACIVKDGELIAAAEEERFRRVKHWAGFPQQSIAYCLKEAGIELQQLDHLAINRNPKANLWKKIWFTLKKRPELNLVRERIKNAREWHSIEKQLTDAFPGQKFLGKVHHIEHHLAHLASAFYVSGFDESIIVSVDGFGDFASTAWGIGRGANIDIENKVYFPHSLGIFYQAITQYLGFPNYGDEYKIMGLAPYGEAKFLNEMRKIVHLKNDGSFALELKYFRHAKEKVEYEWENCAPKAGTLYTHELEKLLGPARQTEKPLDQKHKDIARSAQAMYEEAFFHLLNKQYQQHKLDKLCLAGGCAMNSVANGKVTNNTPFKKVYIQSAAGDAGGAIGSAFVVWHQLNKATRNFVMDHAYWGSHFNESEIKAVLDSAINKLDDQNCRIKRIDDESVLCQKTAQAITDGKVVGWFQGHMEWGPRALGNRSIVCDPRRQDMKEILNLKIKRRESFRPFAPSILREKVYEWFEQDDDVPFMMKVFQIREEKHTQIPAVTHVDGSGRLQTVYKHTNPRYYQLIKSFEALTGIPIILNTSFNENEPVVCRPEEALDCFLRTKMDVLVLGEFFIIRQEY